MPTTSVLDGTNLIAYIPAILAKPPAERTQIEQAALYAYNEKYGQGGADKAGGAAKVEAAAPPKGGVEIKKPVEKI
jgi:hypothetical protein